MSWAGGRLFCPEHAGIVVRRQGELASHPAWQIPFCCVPIVTHPPSDLTALNMDAFPTVKVGHLTAFSSARSCGCVVAVPGSPVETSAIDAQHTCEGRSPVP